jgi:hypothetical protein
MAALLDIPGVLMERLRTGLIAGVEADHAHDILLGDNAAPWRWC